MNLFRLDNKNAVVTGGGSGIGQAIATLFAAQGAHVVALDIDRQGAQETVDRIVASGGTASWRQCDVADHEQVRETFEQVTRERSSIDVLVNSAGIAHVGNVLRTEPEDFERIFRVNVQGVYHCLKFGVEQMTRGNGGAILNLASTASLIGIRDRFAYSMSKGAVLTMTYSVAIDFLKQNIRCNCICPARIHTQFVDGFVARNYPGREAEMMQKLAEDQPIGRMGRPDEVAGLALFLCSEASAFVTGAVYTLDGGLINVR